MPDDELAAKEAYFKEQELLDIPNDEQDVPNDSVSKLERALKDSKTMRPPSLTKQTSSFLGPTPREEFEAHTKRQRATEREAGHKLIHSSTAPESELIRSFPAAKPRGRAAAVVAGPKGKLKRVSSLPEIAGKDLTPFYIRVGDVPRELKNGKNVKPATNIQLFPEHKQYLKDKVVYFYPNDDISSVRRLRIHKVIQLGAAWVKRWREDITHIIVDDDTHTYSQLLRHLNRPGFPKKIVLVKFEPYVPDCIQFGELLDPSYPRFAPKGAPTRRDPGQPAVPSHTSAALQTSLKIKSSTRQIAAQGFQMTDSHPEEESVLVTQPVADADPSISFEETVEDSFVMPSPSPTKALQPKTIDKFNDALSQAILETKATAHLPLEEDEDAESPGASGVEDAEDSGTDEESVATTPKLPKKFNFVSKASALRDKKPFNQNTFQCMDPGANGYTSQNPNARTIQILDEMCKHYDQMQDQWRTFSYRKCITTLKNQTVKITTAKQAAALPFIGH